MRKRQIGEMRQKNKRDWRKWPANKTRKLSSGFRFIVSYNGAKQNITQLEKEPRTLLLSKVNRENRKKKGERRKRKVE